MSQKRFIRFILNIMIAVVATQHLAAQGQSDQIDSVSLMLYKVKGKTYSNGIIEDKLYKLRDYFNQYPTTASKFKNCLLYTSPSPRDKRQSRMPSSA